MPWKWCHLHYRLRDLKSPLPLPALKPPLHPPPPPPPPPGEFPTCAVVAADLPASSPAFRGNETAASSVLLLNVGSTVASDEPMLANLPAVMNDQSEIVSQHNVNGQEEQTEISEEEVISVLEVIASTGKYWHDWDLLKRMISFRLKQVLSEYSESHLPPDVGPQPSSLSGETYLELVNRLDGALHSFDDGPPFTLQRLCEILLGARNIYPVLSKLSLALEKNLLVTSTLPICMEPYRTASGKLVDSGIKPEQVQPTLNGQANGGEIDEEMLDAEEENKVSETDTRNSVAAAAAQETVAELPSPADQQTDQSS